MSNQNSNAGKKNAGYLIANDRSNDRQPHFRGKVSVEGKEYWVSAWRKDPRDGKEMFSIELTDPATLPPRGQGNARQSASASSPSPSAPAAPQSAGQNQSQQTPAPPASPGEAQAFDDIFGGDGSQW